jgi:hypothetical protein
MAVGKIQGPAVRAEGQPVGAADPVDHLVDGEVGIHPVEGADEPDRFPRHLEHRAGLETALAVGLAVVEARLGPASGSAIASNFPVAGSKK